MWTLEWRDRVWSALDQTWDLIIIGGGITGAGILREATRAGYKALLVEAGDFASGTSSRSSKLVHGGLRYLRNAQFKLTIESVRERERLLREGRGLVVPIGFLMPCFSTDPLPKWTFGMGLTIYDLLAFRWEHRFYNADGIIELCPLINREFLLGGYRYFDAQTDDARLVLRIIREACRQGGTALNYARVEELCRTRKGWVCGIVLRDVASPERNRSLEVKSPLIINATGAWADILRANSLRVETKALRKHLRKLRGSHLVFPWEKVPLTRAISFCHPQDGRAVFTFPWMGVTIMGTTDVDHLEQDISNPSISPQEFDYLMKAITFAFPSLHLKEEDVQSTFSGIRAVVDSGKSNPSRESREHVIWYENGLLTVTGGKLTTFRITAHDTLRKVQRMLPGEQRFRTGSRILDESCLEILNMVSLEPSKKVHLLGRYGQDMRELINIAQPDDWKPIPSTNTLWGEIRFACRSEGIVHLDDLLLRRVRLGLLLPDGGISLLEKIRPVVQSELKWDDNKWNDETNNYQCLWRKAYATHSR